jgi:hypothetical protein
MSGGQRLKALKNGDFLCFLFLSLHEGVWGRLSPGKPTVAIRTTIEAALFWGAD